MSSLSMICSIRRILRVAGRQWSLWGACAGAACVGLGGCASPLASRSSEQGLRDSLVRSVRRELSAPAATPGRRVTTRSSSLDAFVDRLELGSRLDELNSMAGPGAYPEDAPLDSGTNLLGTPSEAVGLTLEEAIRLAVANNLQVRFARLTPAVSEAQVVQAEAAFDWVFFSNIQSQVTDQQVVDRSSGGFVLGGRVSQNDTVTWSTGLRRTLTTGAELTIQQDLSYSRSSEVGLDFSPNPANSTALVFQLDQPLLRAGGSDVVLAQVRLARNAERSSVSQLRGEMIRIVTLTEQTYWQLVQAERELMILQRLLERGEKTLEQVEVRRLIDATPAQIADAAARVEARRANVIRAQNRIRRTSDQLKVLINHPEIPVSSELLLVPVNTPTDEPIEFSLFDAVATALEHRPEIDQAILSIDDSTIRRLAADNARLPQLDLRLQARLSGFEDDFRTSYATALDHRFIDTLVGLFFEVPIGNRSGEAQFRQRSLERQQAELSMQNTIQQVVGEIKTAMDNMVTNYELVEQERISRLAAAESLRALEVQKETVSAVSVELLNLELNRQESLADAERREVQAMVDYNTSIADYFAAIGTTLERNRISFVAPNTEQRGLDRAAGSRR